MKLLLSGDSSIIAEFGNEISVEINEKIRGFKTLLDEKKFEFINEYVPTYRSIKIDYNPNLITHSEMQKLLNTIEKELKLVKLPEAKVTIIPTCYDLRLGPDLETVARHNNLTEEEVVKIHTSPEYLIYMLGFTPGFPYLGGMNQRIETPRLSSPRARVELGSVGIADKQTGIYPITSPGGWQIIGRTPIKLYDPSRSVPIMINAGDYIKFDSITYEEFEHIQSEVKEESYKAVSYERRVTKSED